MSQGHTARDVILKALCFGFVAATALSSTGRAADSDRNGAEQFIEQAYRQHGDQRAFPNLFAPPLRSLILRDQRAAASGDESELDYDPICQCQDNAGLTYRIISTQIGPSDATVVVANHFKEKPAREVQVTYRLTRAWGSWLIADVETHDVKSLSAWLRRQLH
jgi:hypothetical protein